MTRSILNRLGMAAISVLVGLSYSGYFHSVDAATTHHRHGNKSRPKLSLQHAVNLIYKDPKAAERELKALRTPVADTFLAFLYLTKKVTVPRSSRRVDALMNGAIASAKHSGSLGDIDATQHYHYKSVDLLLSHIRFIAGSTDQELLIPSALFKQYPNETAAAFGAYFYSSMDNFGPSIDLKPSEDISNIPAVKSLFETMGEIRGQPAGTMQYGTYRAMNTFAIKASLAPKVLLSPKSGPTSDPELVVFLREYSGHELWNRVKFLDWLRKRKPAESALAAHYRDNFGFDDAKAMIAAKRAITGYTSIALGTYSPSQLKEETSKRLYKMFGTRSKQLHTLQAELGGKPLTPEELPSALTMAILNDDSPAVIEWLIKLGAPTTGQIEPAIFSSVLRPAVLKILLDAGADAKEENPLGKTALIQAAQYNALEACKLLIAAGVDVNHVMNETAGDAPQGVEYSYNNGKRTALMYAAEFAGPEVIRYLLQKGADKKLRDASDRAAVDYLKENHKLSKSEQRVLANLLKR